MSELKVMVVECINKMDDSDIYFLRRIFISLIEYLKEKEGGEEH